MIGSPHLLMLSGIGVPDELRAVGFEPRHELRGVGKHLEDHLSIYLVFAASAGSGVRTLSRSWFAAWAVQYLLRRSGPLAVGAGAAGAFVRTWPGAVLPDNQIYFTPYGVMSPNTNVDRGSWWGATSRFSRPCCTRAASARSGCAAPIRPRRRSLIRATSARPRTSSSSSSARS